MKKLDQNLIKWLFEWTMGALIVALVAGWLWTNLGSRSRQETHWEIRGDKIVGVPK